MTLRNASGIDKVSPQVASAASSVLMPILATTSNTTSVRIVATNTSITAYVGKSPRALSSMQLRLRVTTAAATITWCEVAVAKGPVLVGNNPSLTVVGFADVAATFNSIGLKTTTINVSSGQNVNEGDDLWVLIGNQALTALQVRTLNQPDDIQVGIIGTGAMRPSLNVGSAFVFAMDAITVPPPWAALVI